MALTDMWFGSDEYLCDRELAHAFHMARVLGMPLLIEGEPGTGKTELPLQYAKSNDLEMHVFPVGSKSHVEQFVAKFDHVKYLRDSQIEVLNAQRQEKGMDQMTAFTGSTAANKSNVLWILKYNTYVHFFYSTCRVTQFPNCLLLQIRCKKS